MKSRSKGYEVTGVAGLDRIEINAVEINAVEDAAEIHVEITLVDRNGTTSKFDRAALSEFIDALHQGARLATLLRDQLADGTV